jgi:hypothetical protein
MHFYFFLDVLFVALFLMMMDWMLRRGEEKRTLWKTMNLHMDMWMKMKEVKMNEVHIEMKIVMWMKEEIVLSI